MTSLSVFRQQLKEIKKKLIYVFDTFDNIIFIIFFKTADAPFSIIFSNAYYFKDLKGVIME